MYGADHEVEKVKRVVIVVETAIAQDVNFNALENPKLRRRGVELIDLLMLLENLFAFHPTSIKRGLGVIGYTKVGPAASAGRARHFCDAR